MVAPFPGLLGFRQTLSVPWMSGRFLANLAPSLPQQPGLRRGGTACLCPPITPPLRLLSLWTTPRLLALRPDMLVLSGPLPVWRAVCGKRSNLDSPPTFATFLAILAGPSTSWQIFSRDILPGTLLLHPVDTPACPPTLRTFLCLFVVVSGCCLRLSDLRLGFVGDRPLFNPPRCQSAPQQPRL